MGARQREISVSEFFTKNRHLLGFDNPRKALLTCVRKQSTTHWMPVRKLGFFLRSQYNWRS